MPRVQECIARGRLTAVLVNSGKWEFQLTGPGRLPKEGRFWIEPGNRYLDNFCTLLLTASTGGGFDIVVKTAAPISPAVPAVVECMRAVPRIGIAAPTPSDGFFQKRQAV